MAVCLASLKTAQCVAFSAVIHSPGLWEVAWLLVATGVGVVVAWLCFRASHLRLVGQLKDQAQRVLDAHGGSIPVSPSQPPLDREESGTSGGLRAALTDLRAEDRLNLALDQHEAVGQALTRILKTFSEPGDDRWDRTLAEALDSLQPVVPMDRCSLLALAPDGTTLTWCLQWAGPEVERMEPSEQFTRLEDLPWAGRALAKGRTVHVPSVKDLPTEARVERSRWRRQMVESVLAVPMFDGGVVVGLMAFTTVGRPADWQPTDIRLLETLSASVASTWSQIKARREQRAATQKLMDIIEFLPDATFAVDETGRIVAWNLAMVQLTGQPRSAMLGQADRAYAVPFHGERLPLLIDHFSATDLSELAERYQYIERSGEGIYGEMFVPFLNGGRGAYLWCTASPLYDVDGNVAGAIESMRDVTYRKKSESALREGEERYRRLVETLNDGMGIVNAEGLIVFVNDRLCEMTGYRREELLHRELTAFLSGLNIEAAPIDWAAWDLPDGGALELKLPCRDGRLMPVRVSPSALHSEAGDFQGGFAVITDMTTIREAEARYRRLNENLEKKVVESTRDLVLANEALRSSESRYRRIIESLSEGYIFYSLDTRGEFTYISPSCREVLGYEGLSEIFGCFHRWYDEERNAAARLAAEKTSLGFKQPPYDLKVNHADGTPRVLEILEAPVFSEAGYLTSVEGIMHDVTEQRANLQLVREAQAKLIESEKLAALGGMMAGLSHEINTPIGIGVTASSHLEQLSIDCEKEYRQGSLTQGGFEDFLSRSRESSALIQSNLNRAAELLQNFKQVAVDQSAGRARLIELAPYLDEVVHSLSPRLKQTGFKIRCECEAGLQFCCDPGVLYQILANLVINSLNHGFDGLIVGAINISARRENDQIVLVYQDDGNGMSCEQVARIYEPFYTTRRGRGGTGLGMHIVYTNVTQTLGGRITCASRPGGGARFTIAVPLPAEVHHG